MSREDPFTAFGRTLVIEPWADVGEVHGHADMPLPDGHTVDPPRGNAQTFPSHHFRHAWSHGGTSGQMQLTLRYVPHGVTVSWTVKPFASCQFWLQITPHDKTKRPSWFLLGKPSNGKPSNFDITAERLGLDPTKESFDTHLLVE